MTTIAFDKMRDVKQDLGSPIFDFKCIDCRSERLEMFPLMVSYKPYGIDNSDIENEKARKYLDSLPTFKKALLSCISTGTICVKCNECNFQFQLPPNHNKDKLKTYINKTVKENDII